MRTAIPNMLSVSRVLLGVLILVCAWRLHVASYFLTLCLVAAAILTDWLDGYLARRWDVRTEVGYVLDTLGDRSVHLALTLVFALRYDVHPLLIWLLIFRDIGIYSVRILTREWLQQARELRRISLLHSISLRLWLASYVVRDGILVLSGNATVSPWVGWVQYSVLSCSLATGYYSIWLHAVRLIERDHSAP